MAGIFDDIANFFTGERENKAQEDANNRARAQADAAIQQQQAAAAATNAATGGLTTQANLADQLAQHFGRGAQESFGANAADTMRLANQAAEGQANQAATAGSMAAARQVLSGARGAGLNKGQASLRAAQGVGDTYSNLYQGGLESGRNQYTQTASNFANIGAQQQGLGQNARIAQGNIGLGVGNAANAGLGAATNAAQGAAQQAGKNSSLGGEFLNGLVQKGESLLKGGAGGSGGGAAGAAGKSKGGKLEPNKVNIVGENGPEAVIDGEVIPNNQVIDKAAEELSGPNESDLHIADLAKQVFELKRKLKMAGVK